MSTGHDCRNVGICIIHRIPNSLENPLADRRCDRNKNLFFFREEEKKKEKFNDSFQATLYPINSIRMT